MLWRFFKDAANYTLAVGTKSSVDSIVNSAEIIGLINDDCQQSYVPASFVNGTEFLGFASGSCEDSRIQLYTDNLNLPFNMTNCLLDSILGYISRSFNCDDTNRHDALDPIYVPFLMLFGVTAIGIAGGLAWCHWHHRAAAPAAVHLNNIIIEPVTPRPEEDEDLSSSANNNYRPSCG